MKPSDLLTDESRWCQRTAARDERGDPIDPSVDAARLCLIGAMRVAAETSVEYYRNYEAVCRVLHRRGHIGSVSGWNDQYSRSFQEVRAVLLECDL